MSENVFNIEAVVLDEITVVNATLNNKASSTIAVDTHLLEVSYGFDSGLNAERKLIKITFDCEIQTPADGKAEVDLKGRFTIDFVFKVPDLEKLIVKKDGQTLLEADVLVPLANICYSTSRGIIYTRCQGTPLSKMILPLLPTTQIYKLLL